MTPMALVLTDVADPSKPFSKGRREILTLFGRPVLKLLLVFLGVSVRIKGWENYEEAMKNELVSFLFKQFRILGILYLFF